MSLEDGHGVVMCHLCKEDQEASHFSVISKLRSFESRAARQACFTQMFSRPVTNRINGDNLSQRHRVAWVSLRVSEEDSILAAVLMYGILRVFQRALKYGILYHMSKLFSFQAILLHSF